jgi:hypothetical protein
MAMEAFGFSRQTHETTSYLCNTMNAMSQRRRFESDAMMVESVGASRYKGQEEALRLVAARRAHNTVPFSATLLRNSTSK